MLRLYIHYFIYFSQTALWTLGMFIIPILPLKKWDLERLRVNVFACDHRALALNHVSRGMKTPGLCSLERLYWEGLQLSLEVAFSWLRSSLGKGTSCGGTDVSKLTVQLLKSVLRALYWINQLPVSLSKLYAPGHFLTYFYASIACCHGWLLSNTL